MSEKDQSGAGRITPDGTAAGFGVTDLEETLFGPNGAERAKELIQRFDLLKAELESDIKAGLPPDRYEKAQTIGNSLAAARDLLVKILQLLERG